jgi:uncharacterized membrane protein
MLPGSDCGAALGGNDRGNVVGYAGFPGGTSINRGVLWLDGVPTDLDLVSGNSWANDVNHHGQVVGWRELVPMQSSTAFHWNRGTVTNLPSLTGNGGLATAINNRAEIVGSSPIPGNPLALGRAVLWR